MHTKKKLILLSSSAVFNGKKEFYIEDDYRKPINNYGKHKKEIEEYIKKNSKNYAILRLTKVDITLIPLISEWIKKLNSNFSIKPFSNQYLSPVPISSVLSALIILMDKKNIGIFHLSCKDEINYLKVGEIISNYFKYNPKLIIKDNQKLLDRKFTTLRTSKIFKNINYSKSKLVIKKLIMQYF